MQRKEVARTHNTRIKTDLHVEKNEWNIGAKIERSVGIWRLNGRLGRNKGKERAEKRVSVDVEDGDDAENVGENDV